MTEKIKTIAVFGASGQTGQAVIKEAQAKKIKIIPVKTIHDVVDEMIDWKGKEKIRARFNRKKGQASSSFLK